MCESDLKIKSGKYILKENCNKEKEELETKHKESIKKLKSGFETEKKEAINDTIEKAKIDWNVEALESQVTKYDKITNTVAYKAAKIVSEIVEALDIIKKLRDRK